ncbi:MAG: 4Fe-4S ferredoxin, partial [Candidatus Omnitrophica bacterium]|nr:4Fe-4S ferredoxin [Candidatus Omnitrophota bacterium]
PIQINLVPENAPYLKNADLLIAADCVPFAYANFHSDLLKGKTLLVGCPKLDDLEFYREKVGRIIKNNGPKSVTYAHMEVPCCFGLIGIIEDAIASSGKNIPFKDVTITLQGEMKE